MSSDFSALGRTARDLIAVPAVPLDAIHRRAHASQVRSRVLAALACATIALGAVTVGTGAAAKLYGDVRLRLFGNSAALTVDAGVIVHEPMSADLRRAIAGASFPAVFPVGIPAGVRVTTISVSPVRNPSLISVHYEGGGRKFGLALADAAIVDSKSGPTANPSGLTTKSAFHWTVGREVVLAFDDLSASDVDRIKAAMAAASPADSLAATEAMLPKLIVLGPPVRLGAAERYRPATGRSVLVGQNGLRGLQQLIARGKPLGDDRTWTITQLVYANNDIKSAVMRKSHDIAIPANGVRAVGAVLRHAAEGSNTTDCGCEVLFHEANAHTYWIWTIPLTASAVYTARKYSVDARTLAITP
jgi:hypothetical protein